MQFSSELSVSIDRVAEILQINPAHLYSAHGGDTTYQFCESCSDLWCENLWQAQNGLARNALRQGITSAVESLEGQLGHPVAPRKIVRLFPWRGATFNGVQGKFVNTSACVCGSDVWAKPRFHIGNHIVGHRDTRWVEGTAEPIEYQDANGDGVNEVATIAVELPSSGIDYTQIALFHEGHFGDPDYKIAGKITEFQYVGETTIATFSVDAWRLIRPELLRDGGTMSDHLGEPCGCLPVDFSDIENLVDAATVGYVEWDASAPLVRFYIEGSCGSCNGYGCPLCQHTLQTGCYLDYGTSVVPFPATYTEENGWEQVTVTGKILFVEISYWDAWGVDRIDFPSAYPLVKPELQRIVALVAFARMQNGNVDCDCNRNATWKELWREMDKIEGSGRAISYSDLANPFGRRRGEFLAWDIYKSITGGTIFGRGSH